MMVSFREMVTRNRRRETVAGLGGLKRPRNRRARLHSSPEGEKEREKEGVSSV
jgi:hypothetical protein